MTKKEIKQIKIQYQIKRINRKLQNIENRTKGDELKVMLLCEKRLEFENLLKELI